MENSLRIQENQNHSLIPSPNSNSANSSTISNGSSSNGNGLRQPSSPQPQPQQQLQPPQAASVSPIPITRFESNNPHLSTFVQADTNSFKQVVQMLTGSSETAKLANAASVSSRFDQQKNSITQVKSGLRKEKASKLYERRNSLKNFRISPLVHGLANHSGFSSSPRKPVSPEILSPSILDFPSLVLSPVTSLIPDPFNRSPHTGVGANLNLEAKDKAIAKGVFYLHPSPVSTPMDSEPRLLHLFPVISPRVSDSTDPFS